MAAAAATSSTMGVTAGAVTAANKPKPAGRQLGTLVVVIIKARNLPNKQRIGKQDPYCSVSIGHQKQKTAPVKRGGQTPHWDAQLQFEIWEESSDKVAVVASETGGIGPQTTSKVDDLLPGQATVGRAKPKSSASTASKRIMKLACYADDPREPDLIGETEVDYADTLKKGEFDEWVELKYKGKYAGEVFVEMTFYSSAPPPVKRKSKPVVPGSGYGGPGHFQPLPDSFPQSPSASGAAKQRPTSAYLSTSSSHPLRTSQSSYNLSSSTSQASSGIMRPPTSTGSFDEFGQHTTTGAPGFPDHSQFLGSNSQAYTPPYAPPSLAHSASSSNLGRPQRASMSSYGMTQHDIDSLTRPLSSLSIGSVNKPLPLPDPYATHAQSYQPPASPMRPVSGMAYPMAPSAMPQPGFPAPPPAQQAPQLQHHYSQPGPPTEVYHEPPPPMHHHRHSVATYLPDGTQNPWDQHSVALSPHQAEQHPQSQEIGLHNPPASSQQSDHRPSYVHTGGSWQDPRATTPIPGTAYYQDSASAQYQTPTSPVYSPTRLNGHPTALQPAAVSPPPPSTSPHFAHMSPPPPASHTPQPQTSLYHPVPSSPLMLPAQTGYQTSHPAEAPVWDSAAHHASPILQQNAYQPDPMQDQQPMQYAPNSYAGSQAHPTHYAPQHDAYGGMSLSHGPGGQGASYTQFPLPAEPYQSHGQDSQQHYQPSGYSNGNQTAYQRQDASGYSQPQWQAEPSHGHQGSSVQPDPSYHSGPQEHYGQQSFASSLQTPLYSQQQDLRASSPYRPLPQPTPEPGGYPTPPRQPRFGLPPHQAYDPPYIPPQSRQQFHQQPAQDAYAPYNSGPPPIPPVPEGLRQEQYGYNQKSHSQSRW